MNCHGVHAAAHIYGIKGVAAIGGHGPSVVCTVSSDDLSIRHLKLEDRGTAWISVDAHDIASPALARLHGKRLRLCGERLHRQRTHHEGKRHEQAERLRVFKAFHEFVNHSSSFLSSFPKGRIDTGDSSTRASTAPRLVGQRRGVRIEAVRDIAQLIHLGVEVEGRSLPRPAEFVGRER